MQIHKTDVVVIGAGPVGLFAVFECGMLKLQCHVVDTLDAVGGQCVALYPEKPIYDIPAYPQIMAAELIEKLQAQAAPFSPTYHLNQRVDRLQPLADAAGWRVVTSNGTQIEARAVIIAAGAQSARLAATAGVKLDVGAPGGVLGGAGTGGLTSESGPTASPAKERTAKA